MRLLILSVAVLLSLAGCTTNGGGGGCVSVTYYCT